MEAAPTKNPPRPFRSLRVKLLAWFLALSLIPLTGLGVATFFIARADLQQDARDKLEALRTVKTRQIEDYFKERQSDMKMLLDTFQLMRQETFTTLNTVQANKKRQIEAYFKKELTHISTLAGNPAVTQAILALGKANGNNKQQATIARQLVPWLNHYTPENGYRGLILADAEGQILYAASQPSQPAKALLPGENITTNPVLANSPLAGAFSAGLKSTAFQDFEIYPPLGSSPTAYLSAPVKANNQTVGVVILQLSTEQINSIMQEQSGLGKSGAAYLIGADKLFRSDDPRLKNEQFIANPDFVAITRPVNMALQGKTGEGFNINYRGNPVLSTWAPVNIPGSRRWAIVTETSVEEAFTPNLPGQNQDFLARYINTFGYDDLFLIDPDGHFFYVINHHPIYKANLLTGLYKNSNLGQLVAEVLETKQAFEIADFERFAPNNNQPAAFIAAPILYNNQVELVVVVQLSLDQINTIMQERTGLGKTGETYLVGQDNLWRSDSRFRNALGVESTVLNPEIVVDTVASQSALSGKSGTRIIEDYRGEDALSSWSTISISKADKFQPDGVNWAVIAEIDLSEVNEPVIAMALIAGGLGLLAVSAVVILTVWVSRNLTDPIAEVANTATQMAAGNLAQRAHVNTGDEIEVMAGAFNSMGNKLEDMVTSLEQQIEVRRQAEEALRESERYLRDIAANLPGAVYQFYARPNHKFGIYFISGRIEEIFELSADMKNPFNYFVERVDNRDRELFLTSIQHAAQQATPWNFEGRYIKPSGETIWFRGLSTPQPRSTETIFNGLLLDITDQKRAEQERERLIEELEAKNAELERFTYTVSHDLKSPLVTINGFVGMLEKDTQAGDAERIATDIKFIQDAVNKMRLLLDDLLELSRIGRVVNRSQKIAIKTLANEAIDLVAGPIAKRGVQVTVLPNLPEVFGDQVRLLEVYQNLIDNAVKFMGNQPEPHIEIGTRHNHTPPVCYIKDNGIGINPRYHKKVFGLFDRLDQDIAGTGVGLALVKRIIEVHGGRIWIESEGEGLGSTFCFTLPQQEENCTE